MMELAS